MKKWGIALLALTAICLLWGCGSTGGDSEQQQQNQSGHEGHNH